MSEQLFLRLNEAAKVTTMSERTLKRAIEDGSLRAKRTSSRKENNETVGSGYILISVEALREWFDGLVDA